MSKIALVGKGYWGRNWYNTLMKTKHPFCVVDNMYPVSFRDDNRVECFPNLETLFKIKDDITHVIVCTNARQHKDVVDFCSQFVELTNILVEKPCFLNSDEAFDYSECFPGYIFLYTPMFEYVRNVISSKTLFYINSIRASMGPKLRSDVTVIEDCMIHDLYICMELLGSNIDLLSVTKLNNLNAPIQSDTAIVTCKINNTMINLFSSWIYPEKRRECTFTYSDGHIIWRNDSIFVNNSCYHSIDDVNPSDNFNYKEHKSVLEEIKLDLKTTPLERELFAFLTNTRPKTTPVDVWNVLNKIQGVKR